MKSEKYRDSILKCSIEQNDRREQLGIEAIGMEEVIITGMNNIRLHKEGGKKTTPFWNWHFTLPSPHCQGVKVIISDFDMTKSFVSLSHSDPNEDTRDSYDLRSLMWWGSINETTSQE